MLITNILLGEKNVRLWSKEEKEEKITLNNSFSYLSYVRENSNGHYS